MSESVLLVMPTWNHGPLILEAIESIMKQSFTHWHLSIVDDGSQDNTKKIVTDFIYKISKKPRKQRRSISFYSIPHKNTATALNHGFAMSQWVEARYETWISADNIYYPNFLKVFVKKLNSNKKIAFVYSDFQIIDEKGNITGRVKRKPYSKDRLVSSYEQGMCFMWRNWMRDMAGYWFDERLQCEDYNMVLRMSEFGEFEHIPKVLGGYRVHSAQRGTTDMAQHSLEAKRLYFLWKEKHPEGEPETHILSDTEGGQS